MKQRLDRIEDNLEKISDNIAKLSIENAVTMTNVNQMTQLMKGHVSDDLKEHIALRKQIKKNEVLLAKYAGASLAIVFVIGLLVKIL